MSLRLIRTCLLLPCLFFFLASTAVRASDPTKNLPAHYRHWLNEEVPYIINTEERKQFLALANDAERDSFIKAFWDVRNPDPSSGTNEYKEEHYRRLAYANQNYGFVQAQDGWRTDEGRIYITLGAVDNAAQFSSAGLITS